MEKYVDGFVIPVLKENVEKYKELARMAGEIWMENGALEYYECLGDDLDIENMLSFNTIAGASENETVIFAWIVYESREARDRINAAVREDPRMNEAMGSGQEPFDFKRMAYGGFKAFVTLEAEKNLSRSQS
jgi:uncharacterized protein YbaA (DUF1428 family)